MAPRRCPSRPPAGRPPPPGATVTAAIALAFALSLSPAVARSQAAAQTGPDATAQDVGPGVYLVTFGPGGAIWEKFGHNGIWIRDPELGVDRIYDWGRFSFGDGFVGRFLQGYLRYWMGSGPARAYFDLYRAEDRSIWVQELSLSVADRRALLASLSALDTDAHRFYRYNYYVDNCSTRVRDVLDALTGGALAARLLAEPARGTFRFHTQRLTAGSPLTNVGLLLALGPRVDAPATAWDEAFVPMVLRERVRSAVVAGPAGAARPLIAREWTLYEADRASPPDAPPPLLMRLLVIGLALAGLVLVLGARAQGEGSRWPLALTVGAWGLIAGLLGTLIVGLWAGTEHVFTYGNENVAQMNPLSLGLAALGPAAVLRGRGGRGAALLATAIAAVSLAGFALQALPGLDQANGAIVALCLPVHLAVAWVLRGRRAYGWTEAREDA